MPSRQKKVQRDKALTQSFFNQAGSSDPSRNHATRSLKSDDPNLDESAEIGPDDEMLNTVVSLWKEKFKSLTYAESEMQLAASDSDAVDQAVNEELTLALEQMNEVGAMENQSTPMRTFDLDNLNEVAKKYHGLSKMYKDREEREMADVAKLVGDLAITTRDEQRSPEDRLAAELDIHHLNIYSEITVPLASCLAQIQLFNIEKRFGFVEESYQALSNDDMKRRGEDVLAELPLSFRQKLDNPFELTESAPKPRKTRKKKKLSVDKALVQLQRNCKLAIEEMQNLKKIISDAEKPIELPSVPVSFTYGGVPVPKDIPDNIRRRFFDGQFAYQEVLDLQEELFDLVRHVLGALAAWCSTSHEVWEFGKKHVHELAIFREYEYKRLSLHALFHVARRQEVKIVEFYSSEGAPKLPLAMNEALRLKSLSLEEFEKDWEVRSDRLHNAYPSVDKLIAERNKLKEIAEKGLPKPERWE